MIKNTKFKQTEIGLIPENWDVSNFEHVCDKIIDCSHAKKPDFLDTGEYIYLEVSNIGDDGFLNFEEKKFISKKDFDAWTKRLVPRKDDIVITKTGRVGASSIIPKDVNCCIGRNQVILRANRKKLEPHFLWHFLDSRIFKGEIRKQTMTGTILESLHVKYISKLNTPLPPLLEQEKIVSFLDAISYKIELLQKQNGTLEKIGQAIFKHWFVDFDFPNEEGKPYKSSGGKMIDSELGEVPEGWSVGKLGDVLELNIGGDWGKEKKEKDLVPVISLRGTDIDKLKQNGFSEDAPIRWVKKSSIEKREITDCDILMGGSGLGPVGKSIYCHSAIKNLYSPQISYSNFCKRYTAINNFEAMFCEMIISALYKEGSLKQYFTGTSIPNLDSKSLLNHRIIIPTKELLNDFYQIINRKFEYLFNNQIQSLQKTRDLLLPKLMTGKIRVPLEVQNDT